MKRIIAPILLALFLLPHFAYADDAGKRQLAEELLALHHMGEIDKRSAEALDHIALSQLGADDVADKDPTGYDELVKKTSALVAKEFNWNNLKEEYLKLYVDNFTEDELRAILDFSKSPAGQKLQKLNPQLVEASQSIGKRHTAAVYPQVKKLVEAYLAAHKKADAGKDGKEPAAPAAGK